MNWHKGIPPKFLHENLGVYNGTWLPLMDRYWEADEGYYVMSREFVCELGRVQHISIEAKDGLPVGWNIKQQIKDELFGRDRIAIEVYPAKKELVDVMNIYHIWLLPKNFKMPFGIHPTRNIIGEPVFRGYDFNINEIQERYKNGDIQNNVDFAEKFSNSLNPAFFNCLEE